MASEEIGSLKVSLSLDQSDFNRPLASVERNLKALGGELATIRNKGTEWGKSIDGMKSKQEVLGRTLSTQELKVKKLREEYEKSVREKGADAAATENLAAKLNRAVAEYTRTETELNQVNAALAAQQEELRHTESAWGRMESSLDSASEGLTNAGEKMKGVGEKLTLGVTTPLLGLAAASVKVADEFDTAQGKLQAQLGLTSEEAESLGDVAQGVWENAFGDDLASVGDNIAFIKQSIKGLNDGELEQFAEGAYAIQDAFGAEINETTRTASVLMKNFGIDGTRALDLITTGFQRGGDFTGELLDSLREYAPQFKGMGYNAEEFTAILIAGAESGAFNLDKVGDAAKEAFLRIGDGSKSSRDALAEVGLSAKQIEKDINSGGESAKTAFAAVASAIAGIQDPAKRAQTAVALLGTPIEDLGPEFQTFFADVNMDLGEFEGATQKAGEALYDNFGSRMTSVFRNFQSDLEPVGEVLLDVAEEYLPKLADGISDLTEGFADMSPKAQENAVMIAGVAAAAGPALVVVGTLSTGLGAMAKVGSTLAGTLGRAGGAGLVGRIGLLGMTGPVGLAVAGVGLLGAGIYALTKESEANLEQMMDSIDAKQDEIDKNDELIANYEALRSQNELSNSEMLRFLDIQALIDQSSTPDTIAALKDEQAKLLDKSTLTNEEMTNFLGLNQEIIDKADTTVKAISEQGEAYALNTDALKELNAEKAKELENDARNLLTESLERERGLLKEQKQLIEDINQANDAQQETKEVIRAKSKEIATIEREIKDLEAQRNGASIEQTVALDQQIRQKEDLILRAGDEKARAEDLLSTYGKQIGAKDEELDKNRQALAQADAAKFKYEEIILAQSGITAEKGRGIEKIGEEIAKLEQQKQKLRENLKNNEINTAEYQEQNGKIDTQIGKLNEAQGELRLINDIAGKQVFKDVIISEKPSKFWDTLDANLRREVTKNVFIKYNPRSGPQDMGMYEYADGTPSHPGGLAIVGDGVGANAGRELISLPGGKSLLSPDKPTLMDLPRGTSVLSATKTRNMLGTIPRYASGTPNMKDYKLVDYEARLNLTTVGSTINRVREIRAAEMASLEKQIALLRQEGATIKELNQAKEKEARLTVLQADKSREFENRIMQQGVIIKKLKEAFDKKKISLADYNTRVAEATSELHDLKAEQLAFTQSLNDAQRQAFLEAVEMAEEAAKRAGEAFQDMADSQMNAYDKAIDSQFLEMEKKNREMLNLHREETSAFIGELDRQRKASLASYDAQTKAQETAINNQIENINRRRDAELSAIDAQLAALEEIEKAESRDETESGWSAEKEKLKRRLTVAEFMSDENTVKSVQQELAELEKSMSKQRLEWERADTRKALSLEKDRINESYDQQETALENSLRLMLEQREIEREALEARYDLREEHYEAMRAQQLAELEREIEAYVEAMEEEANLERQRFAALQEQLAIHVEKGNLTQKQANEAWLQAIVDTGNDQVLLEIENQNKSTAALQKYVGEYLVIGKSYGNSMIDGVIGTMEARLSEVQSAAAKIRGAMAISASMSAKGTSYYDAAIAKAVPASNNAMQPIHINMDGNEIAAYAFDHATGAMRQMSRKG